MRYLVFSGPSAPDKPDEHILAAVCSSKIQAEVLIRALWPGIGHWEEQEGSLIEALK